MVMKCESKKKLPVRGAGRGVLDSQQAAQPLEAIGLVNIEDTAQIPGGLNMPRPRQRYLAVDSITNFKRSLRIFAAIA